MGALADLQQVERVMSNAFKAIGKSEISAEVDAVFQIVMKARWISEKVLMSAVWRDIDSSKFQNVIDTLLKTGKIAREYKGPKGEPGIWYRYAGLLE